MKIFGQPERQTVCACERTSDSNLGMAIQFFNGPLIYGKLRDDNNRFRKLLAAGKPHEEIIRELYLAAVCRSRREKETGGEPGPHRGEEGRCRRPGRYRLGRF